MAQWGNQDNANNSPIWSPVHINQAPTRANANTLYGAANNTAIPGVSKQSKGITAAELAGANTVLELKGATINVRGTGAVPNNVHGITGTGANSSAAATVRVASTRAVSAAVVQAGQGFANGDTVALQGSPGTQLTVTTNGSGNISALTLINSAIFTTTPAANTPLVAVTGSGNSATATLTFGIDALTVANAGSYLVPPTEVANNALSGNGISGAGVTLNFGPIAGTDGAGVAHTGWVIETIGTGGRLGRVQTEVLVAGGIVNT